MALAAILAEGCMLLRNGRHGIGKQEVGSAGKKRFWR